MPKTVFQKAVFGAMMALVMVYGMEVYNASLKIGKLSRTCFGIPLWEVMLLGVIVVLLDTAIGGPVASRLVRKFVDPRKSKPIAKILAMSVFKVCCMCPLMSLVAVFLFKGLDGGLGAKWVQTLKFNFPMAMGWQLIIAGPLVRILFRTMFSAQLQGARPTQ